ncbi:MAG: fibrobacter succinogenes major paralogous domain-containing protein [Bacteroidales bacterium]|jgi:uncharacterized protein (TIGR02145 family)|nr:fibrobacter succinogenes major paralogous domain-containing protein [Bacteroidales bacterium]
MRMKEKKFYFAVIIFLIIINSSKIYSQNKELFVDSRDSHVYKTVSIGNQLWMAENLAYKMNKGCWAYEDDIHNVDKYGYLYTWETSTKACPSGWHLPNNEEWLELKSFIMNDGHSGVEGASLKSTACWNEDNIGTNDYGFSACLGGFCYEIGDGISCAGINNAFFWSSTELDLSNSWYWNLTYSSDSLYKYSDQKILGFSIRCIKNE